ncbi:hypothetical protein B0H11DRAFT_2354990 [Mycena galericulata]|nr:hypothetical protein B0H11DRAFT_2354990 [Mycena galericulata]
MELERSDSALYDSDTLAGDDLPQVTFIPMSVETFESNRYSRGRYVRDIHTECSIPPFSRFFSRSHMDNWTPHRHPEGALYFMQQQNRLFTDEDLYDDAILAKVNACVSRIIVCLEDKKFFGPADDIDIVLDLIEDPSETIKCGYYLVDHSTRSIFWMDVFDISQLSSWKRVPGMTSASHTSLILEHAYWLALHLWKSSRQHCDLFPSARLPSAAIVSELRDAIIHSAMDSLTSPTTTIPFAVDDLLKMLTLTNAMTSGGPRTKSFGVEIDQGSSSALARLMSLFALERVNHLHGEYAARLDRRKSVYGASPKRHYWMVLLSPLLFNAPNRHLRDLRAIFMDELVSQLSWKRLMEKVLLEWQDMTLYGSLILNANVGILAIPGSVNTPIAQVSSYMSICFGLASIILGKDFYCRESIDRTR